MVFPSVDPERSGCGQVTKRALLDAVIADMEARGLIMADPDLDPDTEWAEYTYSALVAIPTP